MNNLNVFGAEIKPCSYDPLTGFFRDGCCNTGGHDHGFHVICAKLSKNFLEYSFSRGNDLITPNLEFRFPGLKPGNRWCLCASRWKEALIAGVAPKVILESTNIEALKIVTLKELENYV
mgnify:CR=1 FL=1|tara:strand:- start:1313 stop:1669 length:357 start_codon:yes stop_codon:yes gene_type:complete